MTEDTAPLTTDTVARYVRFWNTESAVQRRTGGELFTEDITYIAPVGVLAGVEALADFAEQFVSNVGAYEFRARMPSEVYHDRARLQWELRVGDSSFAEGTDVLIGDGNGRIRSITAFLDRAPDRSDAGTDQ